MRGHSGIFLELPAPGEGISKDEADIVALGFEWGIEPDTFEWTLIDATDADRRARGFKLHLAGLRTTKRGPSWPPRFTFTSHGQSQPVVFEVYRARVFRDGIPGILERVSHPSGEFTLDIRGVSPTWNTKDLQALWRGRHALAKVYAGGRPPQSGTYSDGTALKQDLDPIVLAIWNSGKGSWPSQERVVELLPGERDPKTLRDWVREHLGLSWPDYLQSLGIIR